MGFEGNKIAGALLGIIFLVMGTTFLSDAIYHTDVPETAGYEIEGGPVETAAGTAAAAVIEPVAPLLASADIAAGENVAKKCLACHNFDKGSANKVGPQLYDIVDRAIAGDANFGYSAALRAYAEGGKVWTYDELNGFLYKPKAHVRGTSMGFAGLKKVDERAAMIAYLRSKADTPAPLPDPAAAQPAAADGEAKTDTPMKDATILEKAPGGATVGTDDVSPSGGATGTQLAPATTDSATPAPADAQAPTEGNAPAAAPTEGTAPAAPADGSNGTTTTTTVPLQPAQPAE